MKFQLQEVQRRIGQSDFRAKVIRAFNGRCAVTRCEESAVLEAAHIVPVNAGGTHSLANTLLELTFTLFSTAGS